MIYNISIKSVCNRSGALFRLELTRESGLIANDVHRDLLQHYYAFYSLNSAQPQSISCLGYQFVITVLCADEMS